jgi:GAF domain-containing protein
VAQSFDSLALPVDKAGRYAALAVEIEAVIAGEDNRIARMATVAAMLAQAFEGFIWTGFYLVDPGRPDELVVGPYQGRLGCLRIAIGKGVCGTAAARGETVVVPDVEAFPGHIVCDSRSRSEIVTPVFGPDRTLIGVLDIDSAERGAFDMVDAAALEGVLQRAFGTNR